MFLFRRNYFFIALLLLIIEIIIARYVHDSFIRPWAGDFLVVILLYCFIRAFVRTGITSAAIITLLFAYLVETLQYVHIVTLLGLQHVRLARIIIGTNFAWSDIFAYTLGIATVLIAERLLKKEAANNAASRL